MENMIMIASIIFLFAVFIIGANILVVNYQKQKIRGSAEKRGWKIQNISYRLSVGWNSDYGYQKFDVNFMDEKGRIQNYVAKLRGLFSDVDWIS